jgi:uncharacterized protein (TIGR02611 family)
MSERPNLVQRLLERREHHRTRHPVIRVAWGAAGFLVLLAGIIMLVTPGPAFVLIPVGLAMLALEFEWAERLLEKALGQAEKAKARAESTTRAQRIAGVLGAIAVIAACVAAVLLVNVPVLPDS